jgi:RNA polymerase sigma-70 factor (ECF subfamily)
MRSHWEGLHADLKKVVQGPSATRTFDDLRRRSDLLRRFATLEGVVDYLAHEGGDLDEKDRIVWLLIEEVRHGTAGRLAHALLLLCLWPGLDAAFNRRLRLFRDRPQELQAELIGCFAAQLRRLDHKRVNRVVATLIRNTERDVVAARAQELSRAARSVEVSPDVAAVDVPDAASSLFGLADNLSDQSAVSALRDWLERAIGRDANLVVEVVIRGRDRGDLAAAHHLSRGTLNRRVERALVRARNAIRIDSVSSKQHRIAFVTT